MQMETQSLELFIDENRNYTSLNQICARNALQPLEQREKTVPIKLKGRTTAVGQKIIE